jgi:hypothetical protein
MRHLSPILRSRRPSSPARLRRLPGVLDRQPVRPFLEGRSLRAGLATSAAIAGVEVRSIMALTRHRSVAAARRSIRDGSLFRGNAAAAVGL